MIKLIEPLIVLHSKVKDEYIQLMALIDLDIRNEDELACLNADYKSIMDRRDEIIDAYKYSPAILDDKIYGILSDFYVDYNKLRGVNVKLKSDLMKLLNNYDFEKMVLFFTDDNKRSNSDY